MPLAVLCRVAVKEADYIDDVYCNLQFHEQRTMIVEHLLSPPSTYTTIVILATFASNSINSSSSGIDQGR